MKLAQMFSTSTRVGAQVAEAPGLIGMDGQVAVVGAQGVVEVDDPLHEARREDPDAAEIEQVDRIVGRPDRIVPQVRVTVDHPIVVERHVPGTEHVHRQAGLR